jgi:hypothetical protein
MRVLLTFNSGRTREGYLPLEFPLLYMEEYMAASGADSIEILSVNR